MATSTQAERVFSWMGWLLNKRRLSLSGESVTMQLFLKDNLTIWEILFGIWLDLFVFGFGLDNKWLSVQCSYSSRIIRLSEQCFLFLDSIYNKSRNISQVYRGWLHSLGTRSAVDLKRYSNISQVYRGWLHSLGTRSAVDLLKVFSTSAHTYTHSIHIWRKRSNYLWTTPCSWHRCETRWT